MAPRKAKLDEQELDVPGNDAELEALMQRWRETKPYNPRSGM